MNKKCLLCSKQFKTYESRIKNGKGKYCSLSCSARDTQNRLWKNPEYKKRMSEVHKGQKWTENQTILTRKRMIGNKINKGRIPWNKGMGTITSQEKRVKNDKKFIEWREAVFARDNWTCQKSGEKSGNGKKVILNAHHIQNFSNFPELRMNIENGITLSEKSHKEFHKKYGRKNNTPEQLQEFLKK